MTRKRIIGWTIGLVLFAAVAATGTSCDTMVSNAQVDEGIVEVERQQEALQREIEAAPTEDAKAELNVKLQALNLAAQTLVDVRKGLAVADARSETIAGLATTVGSAVPVPIVNTVSSLLGAFGVTAGVASWFSRMKYAKIANGVLAGIQAGKNDPENPHREALRTALDKSKAFIHAAMDPKVVAAVREAIASSNVKV